MQKVTNYIEWKALSKDAQDKEYGTWNVYIGEGDNIINDAIKELKNIYKNIVSSISISKGIYHGGILVINIDVTDKVRVRFPKIFNGFPIMVSKRKHKR